MKRWNNAQHEQQLRRRRERNAERKRVKDWREPVDTSSQGGNERLELDTKCRTGNEPWYNGREQYL